MKAFESTTVGGIEVKNRIFRSATHESGAFKDGKITKQTKELYRDLSEGEIGLIISGLICFASTDTPYPYNLMIDTDEATEELKELTNIAHQNNTPIVAQLIHIGSQIDPRINPSPYAPSDVTDPGSGNKPTPLSTKQVKELVKEFGEAALRAKKAGFDGVQLHGAHGYLLSKFLSPNYNRRTDQYGGNPVNRVRIITEILEEIKLQCGKEYPVWIKLNCSDFEKDSSGLTFDQLLIGAREIAAKGIDAIELSGGTRAGEHTPMRSLKYEAYHLEYAEKLKKELDIPVISVGGFRRLDLIEKTLQDTDITAISMCRALIREPQLVKEWQKGNSKKAECIACNGCFNPKVTKCIFHLSPEDRAVQKEFLKAMLASPQKG